MGLPRASGRARRVVARRTPSARRSAGCRGAIGVASRRCIALHTVPRRGPGRPSGPPGPPSRPRSRPPPGGRGACPERQCESIVTRTRLRNRRSAARRLLRYTPPKTTEWTTPSRAHASIVIGSSRVIGRCRVARSPGLRPAPSRRNAAISFTRACSARNVSTVVGSPSGPGRIGTPPGRPARRGAGRRSWRMR